MNMSSKLLLPNKFKIVGWCIFIPAAILGVILAFYLFGAPWLKDKVFAIFGGDPLEKSPLFGFIDANVTNTVVGVLFIVGAILVGFSKEKREDECIAELRLSSLLWAVWVNHILLLLAFLFVYDFDFIQVMIYNMFTVMIIFIVRFNYILYKNSKVALDEKQY